MNLIIKIEATRLMSTLYFDHFDYIHTRDKNITHVSDITPDYALLPTQVFYFIKKGLEQKGFNVKVVFLMRDPVERAWSQLRMINRLNHERKRAPKISPEVEFEQLKKFYRNLPVHYAHDIKTPVPSLKRCSPQKIFIMVFIRRFLIKQKSINLLTSSKHRNSPQTSIRLSTHRLNPKHKSKG